LELEESENNIIPKKVTKNTNMQKFSKIRMLFKFFNKREANKVPPFRKTLYHSGDMVSIIMVQKHIRNWVKKTRDRIKNKLFIYYLWIIIMKFCRGDEIESSSQRKTSGTENRNNNIDDMFNLAKAMMKKNRVELEPISNTGIISARESETTRKLILEKKKT